MTDRRGLRARHKDPMTPVERNAAWKVFLRDCRMAHLAAVHLIDLGRDLDAARRAETWCRLFLREASQYAGEAPIKEPLFFTDGWQSAWHLRTSMEDRYARRTGALLPSVWG